LDIEMEMDIDSYQDAPIVPEAYTHDIITGEEQEPGEVDEPINDHDLEEQEKAVVPYKVHVAGLDTFNPDEVKAYVSQHNDGGQFDRIEWIDDSSANLIFRSEAAAQEALVALAAVPIADPTQLPPLESIRAKDFAAKPDSVLLVRFAVVSDKKVVGAAQRSRFYLLHPEYDPEERRRRGKYRDRDDRYNGRGRNDRRGGGRRRDSRYEDDEVETFDVSLYDDDPVALAKRASVRGRPTSRHRRSVSTVSSESDRLRSAARRNREKELFPDRRISANGGFGSGRDRDRSASPVRDRDGDARMDLDDEARTSAELRSREKGRAIRERQTRDTSTRDNSVKELFPTKANAVKELFPTKLASASSIGKAQMDQVDDSTVLASAKLADRITPRPPAAAGLPASSSGGGIGGFNIRGLANKRGNDQGFAIKGTGTTVKELFPDKFGPAAGNAGKELFAEKLEGRGRRRQKAEDSFY
ncbi:hypothetical protein B0T26DRAFT_619752, partial [Lasiosphaeria miniovina]